MGRASNFYYQQNPLEAIGQSLGTALFGDPAAAALQRKQQADAALRDAQTQRELAAAGYDTSRTTGQNFQNTSAQGLGPAMLALLGPQAAPPAAMPSDPLAPLPDAPVPGALDPRALGNVIALIAGAQGDKVDMSETMGSIGAFLGNDEFARRGLVAQGHSPTADFAITPERADAIAAIGNAAKLNEVTSVATINNRDDIAVANANHASDIPVANIKAGASRDVQTIKNDGTFDMGGAASLGSQFGQVTSTYRTPQHNKEVRGAANSYHLKNRGIDIARKPGVSHAQIEQGYRNAGYAIIESIDEGDHSHFALSGGPGKPGKGKGGKAAGAPKGISKASVGLIDDEITEQIEQRGAQVNPRVRTAVKSLAIKNFQRTGDPVSAVRDALDTAKQSAADNRGKAAGANKPPVAGARKAPDGKWYVQQGKNPDGSPKYARVDG